MPQTKASGTVLKNSDRRGHLQHRSGGDVHTAVMYEREIHTACGQGIIALMVSVSGPTTCLACNDQLNGVKADDLR